MANCADDRTDVYRILFHGTSRAPFAVVGAPTLPVRRYKRVPCFSTINMLRALQGVGVCSLFASAGKVRGQRREHEKRKRAAKIEDDTGDGKKDGRMKVGRDVVTVRAKSEGEERGRRERRERQKGDRL